MKEINDLLKQVLSPQRAMEYVRHITLHHRIQASPGYREAAEYCQGAMQAAGVECRILSYAADGEQRYLEDCAMREWSCKGARLELCEPHFEVLCDFAADAMCISQRSAPADFRAEGLDIVCLPFGATRESCAGLDLAGKLVLMDTFTRDGLRWMFEEKQAAGVITDRVQHDEGIRSRQELYDCRTYHSFPFNDINEKEVHGFAFVLTPRQGDRLRKLCADMAAAHEKDPQKPACPRAKGFIDVEFYPGALENVLCTIPGETDECIILTAHLCHPQACANDNASGCAASLELMRALNELIAAGRLPKPRRTIRMLLVPEMLGSNAYLHTLGEGGRKKLIAGVNLDMVGARQGATAGPVIIFRTPEASASLVNDLACLALDEASSDHPAVFSDTEKVGMHHYAVRRFGSGSDHQIFSDPLIGVPCVSFTQWPDLFYHTSGDTVERIDPTLVTKTALIAGDIIWTLANMRESDLDPLLARACESYVAALRRETDLWRAKNEPARALELRLNLTEEAAARALGDLRRLFPGELSATAQALLADERVKLEALKEQALRRALALAGLHRDEAVSKAASDLPKLVRTFLGDPDAARIDKLFEESGSEELIRQHKENHTLESYVNYWTCGLFNFEEIADRALWECGSGDREYIGQYLRILNRAGLVKPVPSAK